MFPSPPLINSSYAVWQHHFRCGSARPTGHHLHQHTLIRLSYWDLWLWVNWGNERKHTHTCSQTQCSQSITLIDQVNNRGRTDSEVLRQQDAAMDCTELTRQVSIPPPLLWASSGEGKHVKPIKGWHEGRWAHVLFCIFIFILTNWRFQQDRSWKNKSYFKDDLCTSTIHHSENTSVGRSEPAEATRCRGAVHWQDVAEQSLGAFVHLENTSSQSVFS